MAVWSPAAGRWVHYRNTSGTVKRARITAVTDATAGAEVLTLTIGCGSARQTLTSIGFHLTTNNKWFKPGHPHSLISSAGTAAITLQNFTSSAH